MDRQSPESDISQVQEEPNTEKYASPGQSKIADTDQQAVEEPKASQVEASDYLRGPRLVLVTVGLMAVVLMVALDNYILGRSTCQTLY